jgi:phage-related protein
MNRLRSSPQGSVLGSLNALFSPHPVTGAPSPGQAAQGGLLGKMINVPGGGAGGTGTSPLTRAMSQQAYSTDNIRQALTGKSPGDVNTTDSIRQALTGQAPGDVITTDTIRRTVTGAAPGNTETTDTIKEKLDPASADKMARDSADSGDKSGKSFAARFRVHLAGMFGGGGGKSGGSGGGKGGKSGGPLDFLDSGLLGGIGPGILGISTKWAGITAGVGSLIGALPALAAGVASLGVAGAGLGLVAVGAKQLIGTKNVKGKPVTQGVLYDPAQAAGASLKSVLASSASALTDPLRAAFNAIPGLAKSVAPDLKAAFGAAGTLVMPLVNSLGGLLKSILPGLSQAFRAVAPLIGPMVKGLGGLVSGILPGLVTLLKAAAPAVDVLFKGLGIIGSGIGQMFKAFAPAVKASAVLLNGLLSVVSALFPVIGTLAAIFATALAPVFASFAKIIKALLPVFTLIGGVIAQFAGAVIGDLASAFGAVASLIKAIGPSLGIFAKAIGNVFAVLENSGVFAELGNALESLAAPLGKMISTLLKGLTPLLPPLIGFLSQVVTMLAAGLTGALLAVIPPLTTLGVKVLGAIASVLPVLLPLLTTLLGLFTGAVVAVISNVATALSAIINAIPPAMLTGLVLAFLAIAGAVRLWAIAQGILDIALNANPIGLVILAVAALAIGITELVTHWRQVWGFIKAIAEDAWNFLTHGWGQWIFPELTLIRVAVELVRDHWRQAWSDIKGAAEDAWHFIFNGFGKFLLPLLGPAGLLALGAIELYQHWHQIWGAVRGDAANLWQWLWNDFGQKIYVFFMQTVPGWLSGFGNAVRSTFNGVVSWLGGIPGRFTGALSSLAVDLLNLGSEVISDLWAGLRNAAGPVVSWLGNFAHSVVNVFKTIWGWFSPSTVMYQGGKSLMDGLFNGIKDHAHKAISQVTSVAGKITAGVAQWRNLVQQALRMEGLPLSLTGNVLYQMQTESAGNESAINLSDSNAAAGDPSRGLMQVIGSTFSEYHWPGTSSNIYDPLANIAAALNYARHVYGPTLMSGGMGIGSGHGYALGGAITEPVLGWGVNSGQTYTFGENGPEWVTPGKGPPSGSGGTKLADSISLMMPEGTAVATALQELTWYLQTAKMRQVMP